ncbi:MAG: nucleotidyltransferase domain-containing protein [Candidatus Orphnella occulta]|nr:nucleotidyltransferase domain-containing protein [Candidatus Orphnella occulta]
MLKQLLGSRTRISVLKLFVFNPDKEYYIREIERLTNEPFDPLRMELHRLKNIGLLKSRTSGRQKYYSMNSNHTLFPDIKSIILKTVGIGDLFKSAFQKKNDIVSAFIYGSYAKNDEHNESDIDIFVVGNITSKELQGIVSDIENKTKREINPTVYSQEELRKKYKSKNNFIAEILKGRKIFLKGDESGLRKLVRSKQTY